MNWKVLAVTLLLLGSRSAEAQIDCSRDSAYTFIVTIDRTTVADSAEVEVLVPSMFALVSDMVPPSLSSFDRVVVEAGKDEMEATFSFQMGSAGCTAAQRVLNEQIIGDKWAYTFWVRTGNGLQERLIEIEDELHSEVVYGHQ